MPVRTVELFAGVGGFRLGLEQAGSHFATSWFNQWEPGRRSQHAWDCYTRHFSPGLTKPHPSNTDIGAVAADDVPDHDLLVGGFPCQDYSVATTLANAAGLEGRKGVLWWEIRRLVEAKKPLFLLLENVDRLLKSPASQRGRDFGVLLWCLDNLGYCVEWRVLNAADYGNAQRRRRVFIFAARKTSGIGRHMSRHAKESQFLFRDGFFAGAFPTSYEVLESQVDEGYPLPEGLQALSDEFDFPFQNAGVMAGGRLWTRKVAPKGEPQAFLGKHLVRDGVASEYFLDPARIGEWEYQKGAKSEPRTAKNGHQYLYAEGGMQFPDLHDVPARTILTSEANRTPNRSTHVVTDPATGRFRFLTPLEVERLMGFPDNWTQGMPERWRYFTMGNALVVPLVTRMGNRLSEWIKAFENEARVEKLLGVKPRSPKQALLRAPRRRAA